MHHCGACAWPTFVTRDQRRTGANKAAGDGISIHLRFPSLGELCRFDNLSEQETGIAPCIVFALRSPHDVNGYTSHNPCIDLGQRHNIIPQPHHSTVAFEVLIYSAETTINTDLNIQ